MGPAAWHHDYGSAPDAFTRRAQLSVHVFYYISGLNGEVGDLVLLPRSQHAVVEGRDALAQLFGTADLPGSRVVDSLPPGSAVLLHSGLLHARRPKPGGAPRYFADVQYVQAGRPWPSYRGGVGLRVAARARELGLDHSGRYAAVLDAATVPFRARPSLVQRCSPW